MEQSEFELQMQRMHGIEVALESALEQARDVRMALVQAFCAARDKVSLEPKTPVVELVSAPVSEPVAAPKPIGPVPGKRRAKCCCGALHWNGKGNFCDICASKDTTLEGAQ